jgi:hypothetical protein
MPSPDLRTKTLWSARRDALIRYIRLKNTDTLARQMYADSSARISSAQRSWTDPLGPSNSQYTAYGRQQLSREIESANSLMTMADDWIMDDNTDPAEPFNDAIELDKALDAEYRMWDLNDKQAEIATRFASPFHTRFLKRSELEGLTENDFSRLVFAVGLRSDNIEEDGTAGAENSGREIWIEMCKGYVPDEWTKE